MTMSCADGGFFVSSNRSNQMVPSEWNVGYSLNHVLAPSADGATTVFPDQVLPVSVMTSTSDCSMVLVDASSMYASDCPSADHAGLSTMSEGGLPAIPVGVDVPVAGSNTTKPSLMSRAAIVPLGATAGSSIPALPGTSAIAPLATA